jgi:hypothetical protein
MLANQFLPTRPVSATVPVTRSSHKVSITDVPMCKVVVNGTIIEFEGPLRKTGCNLSFYISGKLLSEIYNVIWEVSDKITQCPHRVSGQVIS